MIHKSKKSADALDHIASKKPKFSKKDKIAFAKKKAEEQLAADLKDPKVVKETSKKFKNKVNDDLKKAGLPPAPIPAEPEVKPLPNWIDSGRFDTIEIKVDLDTNEKNAAGQELAHKKKQRDQVDLEKKQHMSSYKDRLDEITAQMGELSDKVTLGYEYRKFRCTLHFDFLTKERVYKDADTGKEISRRALQADDYQMRLPV